MLTDILTVLFIASIAILVAIVSGRATYRDLIANQRAWAIADLIAGFFGTAGLGFFDFLLWEFIRSGGL